MPPNVPGGTPDRGGGRFSGRDRSGHSAAPSEPPLKGSQQSFPNRSAPATIPSNVQQRGLSLRRSSLRELGLRSLRRHVQRAEYGATPSSTRDSEGKVYADDVSFRYDRPIRPTQRVGHPPHRADHQCLEIESSSTGGVDGLQLRGASAGIAVFVTKKYRSNIVWLLFERYFCVCAKFSSHFVLTMLYANLVAFRF